MTTEPAKQPETCKYCGGTDIKVLTGFKAPGTADAIDFLKECLSPDCRRRWCAREYKENATEASKNASKEKKR